MVRATSMDKTADTDQPVLDAIAKRWSPRAFTEREPSEEQLALVFEAARWAPSSFNLQPWRYIVTLASDGRRHADALAGLNEFNRSWAAAAPVLGFSLAEREMKPGKANLHAWHDVGAASTLLSIQAATFDLMVHQMAGIERQVVRERFAVPDSLEVVAGFAMGWPGDPDQLSDKLRERELSPRTRTPRDAFVFRGPLSG